MMNIYKIRSYGTIAFILISLVVVAIFLYISNNIVNDLAIQERERMEIWANAERELARTFSDSALDDVPGTDIDFLWGIIEGNHTIPVLLTNDNDSILSHKNFDLPEPIDSTNPQYISRANMEYLQGRLEEMKSTPNVIHITIEPDKMQHIYYEDSKLLKKLSYYPYIQILVMLAFIIIVYFAVLSTKKAEQNKVWVGLSKETAHQLGTPISSLMAWMEYLESTDTDPEIVKEMNKDVTRLSTIASRFSKVGSKPQIEPSEVNKVVAFSVEYMSTRISSRIKLTLDCEPVPLRVKLSDPLFQWVMENLIKNAVDAMDGKGSIRVTTSCDHKKQLAVVEVSDTGKGLSRKKFKTIFNPGYTTKKRGWGLGLTLAKRIIEQYHDGHIFVKSSEPGVGTTFRIELPLCV